MQPAVDKPDTAHLMQLGNLSFLAARDRFARRLKNAELRQWFEPAILSGQFEFLIIEKMPRALITWAHLDEAGENALRADLTLPPIERCFAGNSLWILSVLCPYDALRRRTVERIAHSVDADAFHALRIGRDGRVAVCHYRRVEGRWQKTKTHLDVSFAQKTNRDAP